MTIQAVGALSLGFVVGWTARYFLSRFKVFDAKSLTGFIGVVVGGAAVKLLSTQNETIWFYMVGLMLGFVLYMIVVFLLTLWESRQGGTGGGGFGSGGGTSHSGGPFDKIVKPPGGKNHLDLG